LLLPGKLPGKLTVFLWFHGCFGSIRDAYTVWGKTELAAMQTRMLRVNDSIGQEVIAIDPFDPEALGGAA